MSTLALAVVGAGSIGRRHIELIGQEPRARLASVVDPSSEARAYAAILEAPHFESIDALLAVRERPDGVIIATPNAQHVPDALACIAHDVPALIEKPLADSADAALPLVAACQRSATPMLVGHHRRHSAVVQAARAMIESGRLGRIVAVSGSALFHKPDAYFEAAWRRQAGGGPIMINMVHEIDVLRYLCGDIAAVQAMSSTVVRGFAVEDSASITLRFASGALGSFVLSDAAASPRSWELTSGENPDYPRHDDQDCLFIAGTHGSLALPTLRWWRYAADRSWWLPFESGRIEVEAHDPLAHQLKHFCDVIERRARPLVGVADAACNLQVLAAIAAASRDGNTRELLDGS